MSMVCVCLTQKIKFKIVSVILLIPWLHWHPFVVMRWWEQKVISISRVKHKTSPCRALTLSEWKLNPLPRPDRRASWLAGRMVRRWQQTGLWFAILRGHKMLAGFHRTPSWAAENHKISLLQYKYGMKVDWPILCCYLSLQSICTWIKKTQIEFWLHRQFSTGNIG